MFKDERQCWDVERKKNFAFECASFWVQHRIVICWQFLRIVDGDVTSFLLHCYFFAKFTVFKTVQDNDIVQHFSSVLCIILTITWTFLWYSKIELYNVQEPSQVVIVVWLLNPNRMALLNECLPDDRLQKNSFFDLTKYSSMSGDIPSWPELARGYRCPRFITGRD